MIIEKREIITLSQGEQKALDLTLLLLDGILRIADDPDLIDSAEKAKGYLLNVCEFINEEAFEVTINDLQR